MDLTEGTAFVLQEISKSYQGKTVLQLEQLVIPEGQVMGLVGPSGAGKSTLLRLLNFVEATDTGSIAFNGQVYNRDKLPDLATRRKITTVFQRPFLMTASVWYNIMYPLKIRRNHFDRERVEQIIERLGLSSLKHQRADKLSGGEGQRVSLARALVFRPPVLLLDEPTANLDPANVQIIEEMIADYVATEKATVVMVTHNVFQAKRLAHRVSLLCRGELVETSERERFFQDPGEEVTRQFLSGDLVY